MLLVATAWIALALPGSGLGHGAGAALPSVTGHHLPAHDATTAAAESSPLLTTTAWLVMCVAMMLPLALRALRHVALNSMRGRRHAGMVLFALGFLVPWLLLGMLVLPVASDVVAVDGGRLGLATALLVGAAAWQVSPFKRWAVLSCSRTVPLAPYGPRAWSNRVEFGLRQSLRCAAACWPVMLLMAVLPHGLLGLVAMAVLTAVMLLEMQSRHRRRLLPWLGVPFGLAAVVTGMMAL